MNRHVLALTCGTMAVSLAMALPAVKATTLEDCNKAQGYYKVSLGKQGADRIYLLERVIELCPSHAQVRKDLLLAYKEAAEICCSREEYGQALEHYNKSLDINPHDASTFTDRAKVYYLRGQHEMARDDYREALRLKPDEAKTREAVKALESEIATLEGGFKTADQIMKKLKHSAGQPKAPNLMGFQNVSVPKHRERFENILFEEWSYTMKPESIVQVQEVGKALSSLKGGHLCFAVEGHTDNRGDEKRNMELSQQRAEAVKNYLVKEFQIDPGEITSRGFGYTIPLVPNTSPENMRRNRRVEILFLPSQ